MTLEFFTELYTFLDASGVAFLTGWIENKLQLQPAAPCLRKSVTQIIDIIQCIYVSAPKQSEQIVKPKFIIYRQKQDPNYPRKHRALTKHS
jgi:hypothetical protein